MPWPKSKNYGFTQFPYSPDLAYNSYNCARWTEIFIQRGSNHLRKQLFDKERPSRYHFYGLTDKYHWEKCVDLQENFVLNINIIPFVKNYLFEFSIRFTNSVNYILYKHFIERYVQKMFILAKINFHQFSSELSLKSL